MNYVNVVPPPRIQAPPSGRSDDQPKGPPINDLIHPLVHLMQVRHSEKGVELKKKKKERNGVRGGEALSVYWNRERSFIVWSKQFLGHFLENPILAWHWH